MTDDLLRRLADLANEPVAGLDPAFADALGERLRAVPGPVLTQRGQESTGRHPVLPIRRSLMVTGMALALAAAAIIAAVLLSPSHPAHPHVQLAKSTDTQVIRPDGHITPASAGAVVPNGAIVRTGPAGQTGAGGVDLGPNMVAIALDGHLRAVATPEPAKDHNRGSTGTGETTGGRAGSLHLVAHRAGGGGGNGPVTLRWSRFSGPGLYGYVVLRAGGGGTPTYGRDAIGFTGSPSATDQNPPAGTSTYRIAAVDRQGRVLAETDSVTVGGD
jgi:hypothetical protein